MNAEPRETSAGYLRRVLPDVPAITAAVQEALAEPASRRYTLSIAIAKTQKLLDDLMRAERVDRDERP